MTAAPPGLAADHAALLAVLGPVFGATDAHARRGEVLASLDAPTTAFAEGLSALDGLIQALRARLAEDDAPRPSDGTAAGKALDEGIAAAAEADETPTDGATADSDDSDDSDGALVELDDDSLVELVLEDDDLGGAADVAPEAPPELIQPELMAEPPPGASATPRDRAKNARAAAFTRIDAREHQAVTRLYEDLIWLFSINDFEAALISLERLLVMAELGGEVADFVTVNQVKLIKLYEDYMGPFDKVPGRPKLEAHQQMPAGYASYDRLGTVMALADGKRSIAAIMETSDLSQLQVCAALNQLHRAGILAI